MREFFLLPALAVAGMFVAAVVLALSVFIVLPALIGIGILFWIGKRQDWARIGGFSQEERIYSDSHSTGQAAADRRKPNVKRGRVDGCDETLSPDGSTATGSRV